MRFTSLLIVPSLSILLSGCGAALQHWENQNNFMVSADDLDMTLKSDPQYTEYAEKYKNITTLQGDEKKIYLGFVVGDSQFKCAKFLNGLVLAQNTSNVSLDIMTTIFSALGTAFTPVSTIHAMTAGATITSGSKTAIDSDIYAKATIGNYAQAIQAGYYSKMEDYRNALTDSDSNKLIVTIEVEKIRSIHKECSLAAAQSTISATLQASGAPQNVTTSKDTWVVSSTVKKGDSFTLTAKLANGTTVPLKFTVKTNKPADLAADIVGAVNTNSDLQKASVTATKEDDGVTVDFQAPAAAGVVWSVDSNVDFQQKGKQTTTSTVSNPKPAQGGVAPSLSPSSGVTTKGAVPGSALK